MRTLALTFTLVAILAVAATTTFAQTQTDPGAEQAYWAYRSGLKYDSRFESYVQGRVRGNIPQPCFTESWNKAVAEGTVVGYPDGSTRPQALASRDEIAEIAERRVAPVEGRIAAIEGKLGMGTAPGQSAVPGAPNAPGQPGAPPAQGTPPAPGGITPPPGTPTPPAGGGSNTPSAAQALKKGVCWTAVIALVVAVIALLLHLRRRVGPQGPQGVPGPVGPAGPQGPIGPIGPAAAGGAVDETARRAAADARTRADEARRRADAAGRGAWAAGEVLRLEHAHELAGDDIMARLRADFGQPLAD